MVWADRGGGPLGYLSLEASAFDAVPLLSRLAPASRRRRGLVQTKHANKKTRMSPRAASWSGEVTAAMTPATSMDGMMISCTA